MNTVIRRFYSCPELNSCSYPFVQEEELQTMRRMNKYSPCGQSCFPFVRKTASGEIYFDIYFWNEMDVDDFYRFVIQKDHRLTEQDEMLFCEYCSKQEIDVPTEYLRKVMEVCEIGFPELHMIWYEEPLHMISHLYFTMHRSGPKELLYKANLDYIAEKLDAVDGYNVLATTPSDMFDGIPMKMLRILNEPWRVECLINSGLRIAIKERYKEYAGLLNSPHVTTYQYRYFLDVCMDEKSLNRKMFAFFQTIENDKQYRKFIWYQKHRELLKRYIRVPSVPKSVHEMNESISNMSKAMECIEKEEELNSQYTIQYEKCRQLEYEDEENIIMIPQTWGSVFDEAQQQHNCLVRYIHMIACGDDCILFWRKKAKSDRSYITMEVIENVITQAYGCCNRELVKQEVKWLKQYARKKNLYIDDSILKKE